MKRKEIIVKGRLCEDRVRLDLLDCARKCWEAMDTFREERKRNKRFTFGDQWGDLMPTPEGMMREEDYIRAQGNIPLKNNLIRRLVRNVLGVFRNQWKSPVCEARDPQETLQAELMQRLLDYSGEVNRMEEVYARTLEEFLISGLAIHRKWFGLKGGKPQCQTDAVSPDNFFLDAASRDFLNRDMAVVGELHDLTFGALCSSFASSPDDYETLQHIYMPGPTIGGGRFGMNPEVSSDFFTPSDPGLCRVIEIWTREFYPVYVCHDPMRGEYFRIRADRKAELVDAVNRRRRLEGHDSHKMIETDWRMDEEWHFHFLTPDGVVLGEGKSPYAHGQHPYAVKAYPFIDGEIHSFVSDIIDQQKYTNRLISMYDWVLRASAKGVLLFPEGALPEGVELSDIAEEWSRFNGVIVFRPRAGVPVPQQVSSNASNIGITDLLNIQMNMMEDISGVNGALQGKLDSSTMSGTLYDQQTRNSLTALADLLKTYEDFILEATALEVSNIRQFYTPAHIRAVTGDKIGLEESETFFNSSMDFSLSM